MIVLKTPIRIIFSLIVFALLAFQVFPDVVIADDDEKGRYDSEQHEVRAEKYDHNNKSGWDSGEEGNELTGQIVLWLLVSANLTVLFSFAAKGITRFVPLAEKTKNIVRQANQLQKKYLMRFHFVLNPIALSVAIVHFLLSSCRKSFLPEWGLVLMVMMVSLGLLIKFKTTPKPLRRKAYRLHTGLEMLSIMIVLLLSGHILID